MKRVRRHSNAKKRCRKETGSSFSHLPNDVLVNILLRLSIESIFVFRRVCKTWYDLVSNPEFAKLHFDQAQVYPLIHAMYNTSGRSKEVHLVHPDKENFELKLGMCDHPNYKPQPGCVCDVQVNIGTKFQMPLMNFPRQYDILTCNGLLCLSYASDHYLGSPSVCNPITGEFIYLPEIDNFDFEQSYKTRYGFGFSPTTNQYKVIRMSKRGTGLSNKAEVHILGTKTWKYIGFFTQSKPRSSPAYLNGFLYWSSKNHQSSIFTFDIEKERFGSLKAPRFSHPYKYDSVGVLGGELCISRILKYGALRVWTMKDNAWSVVFSSSGSDPVGYLGPYQPIKYLNDGAFLMFNPVLLCLVYVDPKEKRLRYLNLPHFKVVSNIKAMAYIPSFISLKHALSGQDVKVRNVKHILIDEDEEDMFHHPTCYGVQLDSDSDFDFDFDCDFDCHRDSYSDSDGYL